MDSIAPAKVYLDDSVLLTRHLPALPAPANAWMRAAAARADVGGVRSVSTTTALTRTRERYPVDPKAVAAWLRAR